MTVLVFVAVVFFSLLLHSLFIFVAHFAEDVRGEMERGVVLNFLPVSQLNRGAVIASFRRASDCLDHHVRLGHVHRGWHDQSGLLGLCLGLVH
jgi:hypothetical protein